MPPFIVDERVNDEVFPFEFNKNWKEHIEELYQLDKTLFKNNCWEKEEFVECSENDATKHYFTLNPIDKMKHPTLISYAGYEIHPQISSFCEITVIGVAPQFHGKNLGKYTLVALLMDAYKNGVKIAQLHVKDDNQIAIELYKKVGFKITRMKENYYSEDESDSSAAYVMEMRLNYFELSKIHDTSIKKIKIYFS
jgi:[ribosomal protein S18]-alanine N-acetyltransferase